MTSTYAKDFSWRKKHGTNSPDFYDKSNPNRQIFMIKEIQIARFL
jgi:hypothetical protein